MSKFAKAIYATVVAGLGSLAAVLVDGAGFSDITAGAWVTIVLAALVAGGGVYGINNAPSTP